MNHNFTKKKLMFLEVSLCLKCEQFYYVFIRNIVISHRAVFRKLGVAKFFENSLNAPDLSVSIEEGVTKVRFKCQGCHEAKKFAEH